MDASCIGTAFPLPKDWGGIGVLWPDVKSDLAEKKGGVQQELAQPGAESEFPQWKNQEHQTDSLVQQDAASASDRLRKEAIFEILESLYSVHDSVMVQRFLAAHPPLTKLLFSAFPKVRDVWGDDAKADLQLFKDPEDDSVSLVVYVLSDRPDAHQVLDRFDEDWWLSHAGKSEGLLTFSVP